MGAGHGSRSQATAPDSKTVGSRSSARHFQRTPISSGTGYDPFGSVHTSNAALARSLRRRTSLQGNAGVQRDDVQTGSSPRGDIGAIARHGASGDAAPLPHLAAIQRSFGRGVDLSGVRAHGGDRAASAAARLDARAYTVGDDVVFGGPPTLRTAAHEAAHVVQQRGGIDLPNGMDRPGDAYEQHADAVADRVVRGETAADLLDASSGAGISSVVQRQSDAGVDEAPNPSPMSPYYTPTPHEMADRVRDAMTRINPIAGVGDFHEAYALLNGLSLPDMVAVLRDLAGTHELGLLIANFGSSAGLNQPRLQWGISVAQTLYGDRGDSLPWDYASLQAALDVLPRDQVDELIGYIAANGGTPSEADMERLTLEGQKVLNAEEGGGDAGGLGVPGGAPPAAGAVAPIGPGFWTPGNIPKGFYIGNAAHIGIAAYYTFTHVGEVVFTNFFSIASIVQQMAGTPQPSPGNAPFGPLSTGQLEGEPDIANMTRHHLYEIKPAGSEALALAEAEAYQAAFAMSGIAMELGPSTDLGVNGFFYNIGWYFNFYSPEPGVVVYRRQKAPPVPVLVPAPQPSEVPNEAPERSWRFSLPRLTPQQKMAMVATLTVGTILLIGIVILLSPVGA